MGAHEIACETLSWHLDLNHAPVATYFQHPAHDSPPKAKAILVQADQDADEVGLDDEVMDGAGGWVWGWNKSTCAGGWL